MSRMRAPHSDERRVRQVRMGDVQGLAIQYPMGTKFTMFAIRYPVGSESKSKILSPMGRELNIRGQSKITPHPATDHDNEAYSDPTYPVIPVETGIQSNKGSPSGRHNISLDAGSSPA